MATGTQSARRQAAKGNAKSRSADPIRGRLIEAAGEVFAELGYEAATVREICQNAGANIAAVNYYFGDKFGLYKEVLQAAVSAVGRGVKQAVFDRDMPPEATLRAAIKFMLFRLYGLDRPALPFRLLRHEMIHPTPALPQIVDQVMRPTYTRLRATIGAMLDLPPDDEKVRLCAHSVMGQIILYPQAKAMLSLLWPQLKMTPEMLERVAGHIADFSLAYLRSAKARA
ncbi:MAG: CerR family C-terminal domain-containing protein [Candidatus Eremiobacteraeota bacterium]|nr:CerR family C-terminal domain-containing protein [Candidatus Eremiobacteraeota bacterium]